MLGGAMGRRWPVAMALRLTVTEARGVRRAARHAEQTPSAWMRRAVRDRLAREGS